MRPAKVEQRETRGLESPLDESRFACARPARRHDIIVHHISARFITETKDFRPASIATARLGNGENWPNTISIMRSIVELKAQNYTFFIRVLVPAPHRQHNARTTHTHTHLE